MFNKKTLQFLSSNNITLQADFYKSNINRKNITIFYFHGGGFLYGVRDDFPSLYINMFLNAGYDFLALDYPLAPETPLPKIIDITVEQVMYYLNSAANILDLPNKDYVFLGRSAGAYLAFMVCQKIIKAKLLIPQALISMYGYASLDDSSFSSPSKHYNKLPVIDASLIDELISPNPIVSAPITERFALYIHARQNATWLEYLNINNNCDTFLSNASFLNMPPTFLVSATLDPDIPYRLSKQLSKKLPNAKLLTLYLAEHDFDRSQPNLLAQNVYKEIIDWLNSLV